MGIHTQSAIRLHRHLFRYNFRLNHGPCRIQKESIINQSMMFTFFSCFCFFCIIAVIGAERCSPVEGACRTRASFSTPTPTPHTPSPRTDRRHGQHVPASSAVGGRFRPLFGRPRPAPAATMRGLCRRRPSSKHYHHHHHHYTCVNITTSSSSTPSSRYASTRHAGASAFARFVSDGFPRTGGRRAL